MWEQLAGGEQPWWLMSQVTGLFANMAAVMLFSRARRDGCQRAAARAAVGCLLMAAVPLGLGWWSEQQCLLTLQRGLAETALEHRWIPQLRGHGSCAAPFSGGLALASMPLGLGVGLLVYALQASGGQDRYERWTRRLILAALGLGATLATVALWDFLNYDAFIYPLTR